MSKKKVLVVDDSPVILNVFEQFGQHIGVEFLLCSSPKLVKQRINGDIIHLAITDVEMPGISGFQFIDVFKRTHPGVPFVFMSSDYTYKKKAMLAGAKRFLVKPFDLKAIVAAVNVI